MFDPESTEKPAQKSGVGFIFHCWMRRRSLCTSSDSCLYARLWNMKHLPLIKLPLSTLISFPGVICLFSFSSILPVGIPIPGSWIPGSCLAHYPNPESWDWPSFNPGIMKNKKCPNFYMIFAQIILFPEFWGAIPGSKAEWADSTPTPTTWSWRTLFYGHNHAKYILFMRLLTLLSLDAYTCESRKFSNITYKPIILNSNGFWYHTAGIP